MDFNIEKTISPFIQSQFPAFYEEEGPNFILFTKAYYEWMESQGKPIGEGRNLFDYRDIDNTLTEFLEHFQQKYLYGIPFNIIANKRFLLKHVLDVYRSKGSINCYKLLFKLLYNQDCEIYLPGRDILRVSDGTWNEPQYIEVSDNGNLQDFVGLEVYGINSGASAVVESLTRETVNQGVVCTLYISNLLPVGGAFEQGEKIVLKKDRQTADLNYAPTVLGSLKTLEIVNGGQDFHVGDILKIAHYDPVTGKRISFGLDGLVRVANLSSGNGSISFSLSDGGAAYRLDSPTFVYRGEGDTTGVGASFTVGSLAYIEYVTYNSDLICDHMNQTLDSNTFNFPADPSGNVSSNIGDTLHFVTEPFGAVGSLDNINTGNSYVAPAQVFIRSTIDSSNQVGTISFSSGSANVVGNGTIFTSLFRAEDVILIKSDAEEEHHIIKTVVDDSNLVLYGPPAISNTAGVFAASPLILAANYGWDSPLVANNDGTINGENAVVIGTPVIGNNIVSAVAPLDSGKGYIAGEFVRAYRYGGLEIPTILNGGRNYSNNDPLIITGGGTSVSNPQGYVTTDANGTITAAVLTKVGSGLTSVPNIVVKSANGTGAVLTSSLTEFNTTSSVQGYVQKQGVGKKRGYWTTTRGFLNSDKKIQDSYFYQDFSYQIRVATMLDKYKEILYSTFHPSGTEMFGEYRSTEVHDSQAEILFETTQAVIS